ncbi:MAG: bifunctional transcriptional activator/DNA repair enzyme AdaA [Janthinobacterium lividum]
MKISDQRRQLAQATLADPRWTAITSKSGAADGSFVFGVRSTGIYCRPSCGARLPLPENVSFHADGAAARAAGLRPCKRCKPDQEPSAQPHLDKITAACRAIDASAEKLELAQLASQAGMSSSHFHRLFKSVVGLTPAQYALARREDKVRALLAHQATDTADAGGFNALDVFDASDASGSLDSLDSSDSSDFMDSLNASYDLDALDALDPIQHRSQVSHLGQNNQDSHGSQSSQTSRNSPVSEGAQGRQAGRGSVTAALYEAGYNANSRFYENADHILGMTPTHYRAGGEAMTIRFAIGQCALGAILVAQSQRGVCAVLLGDDAQELARELQTRFRHATLIGGDAQFEQVVATVVGLIEQPGIGLDLPLDIRGTAFQQRVWQALRKLAPGETVSYAELARRIDAPGAARAVAQACAANPLAVLIPCHRVVKSDGALSGYRWGVERKQALLSAEAQALQASTLDKRSTG